jgi:hypothetical protein
MSRPARVFRTLLTVIGAILAAVSTTGAIVVAGWQSAVAVAAGGTVLLISLCWVLASDARTARLRDLIRAWRDPGPGGGYFGQSL